MARADKSFMQLGEATGPAGRGGQKEHSGCLKSKQRLQGMALFHLSRAPLSMAMESLSFMHRGADGLMQLTGRGNCGSAMYCRDGQKQHSSSRKQTIVAALMPDDMQATCFLHK